jgi:hypothetical protein
MAAAAASQTYAPAPAPNSAACCRPLGNPTTWWAARFRALPASAPPDGDDGAPGWGRLQPALGSVGHQPCSRPPWLSMTGIVWGGGEGGAMLGGGAIIAKGAQELHRKQWTTNKRQSKVDKGWLSTRGSISHPYLPPPKRHNLPLEFWGEGVAGSIWHGKKGPGTRL